MEYGFYNDSTVGELDDFHTPLKKLDNKPIDDRLINRREIPKKIDDSSDELIPLNKLSEKVNQTKMFNKQKDLFNKTNIKPPIYYKPPSSSNIDNKFGIDGFLPPQITRSKQYSSKQIDQQTDENVPKGHWSNDYMKIALGRQVNKEFEAKTALRAAVILVSLTLINRFLALSYKSSVGIKVFSTLPLITMVLSMWKVLKAQDQCLDLPLTNRQRELIGLERVEEELIPKKKLEKTRYKKG